MWIHSWMSQVLQGDHKSFEFKWTTDHYLLVSGALSYLKQQLYKTALCVVVWQECKLILASCDRWQTKLMLHLSWFYSWGTHFFFSCIFCCFWASLKGYGELSLADQFWFHTMSSSLCGVWCPMGVRETKPGALCSWLMWPCTTLWVESLQAAVWAHEVQSWSTYVPWVWGKKSCK
jgi:hypothetical protein